MPGHVLVVDDDRKVVKLIASVLGAAGIDVASAADGAEGLRKMEDEPGAAILDIHLPDMNGKELLEQVRARWPHVPIVMITGFGDVEQAVECMQRGASDFVQKPFQSARLLAAARNALTQGELRARIAVLSRELTVEHGLSSILGASPAIRRAVDLLKRCAQSDVAVLLEGETGTGKELAARAVHAESARREGPFVTLDCGAIPETHAEVELFGHERVAFEGATSAHKGVFERAGGGTLFLDEIEELRPDLQLRLLRVIESGAVTRAGGTMERRIDARIVSGSRRDLRDEVRAARLREDLYYRLAVFPVRLPPLREREGDVPRLAHAFLARYADRHRRQINGFTDQAMQALLAYGWPGNVRELENAVERAVVLEDAASISLESLPDVVVCAIERSAASIVRAARGTTFLRVVREAGTPAAEKGIVPLEEVERRAIVRALEATAFDVQKAAALLGISRATLYRRAEKYRYRRADGD